VLSSLENNIVIQNIQQRPKLVELLFEKLREKDIDLQKLSPTITYYGLACLAFLNFSWSI